ncbi:MAG: glycosyltransferase family 4 protein [Pseudomonadales bacterium]
MLDGQAVKRQLESQDEIEWLKEIGPHSRELESFVTDNAYRFDVIVFVTYLYAPTTLLLASVRHKAILVPNAHDELPLAAKVFDDLFSLPRFVACNAFPELEMLRRRSRGLLAEADVVAMGFDKPEFEIDSELELPSKFLLYAGRIQAEKGCDEMFSNYQSLPKDLKLQLPLLLIGSAVMEIPEDEAIRYLGFVSESAKYQIMSRATALVMPSRQESLSIVLMESWLVGVPALVNNHSEVLADHMSRSGAGFGYDDQAGFHRSVKQLIAMQDEERKTLAHVGAKYVNTSYSWPVVTAKYERYAELIQAERGQRRKLCFVIQRCGNEVNGGAELLCLKVAQRLSLHHDVTIVTTCARDYTTWENFYQPGEDRVQGVKVLRFSVDQPRDVVAFNSFSESIRGKQSVTLIEGEEWVRAQGPFSSSLHAYLKSHVDHYDGFLFFTYLYATTYFGIQNVGNKALLAPFVHDEWMLDLGIWEPVFKSAQSVIYSTPAERKFLYEKFPLLNLQGPVTGLGIDRPAKIDPRAFRAKFGMEEDFIIYVGRIDESKGCGELFDMFLKARREKRTALKLVLIGKAVIDIPDDEAIVHVGFVEEQDKWNALAAANFLVLPSRYESLSMVLLEAWAVSKPVLVNGDCQVLVDQCRRSNGGIWYDSPAEFVRCIEELTNGASTSVLGRQGNEFVNAEYNWEKVDQMYLDLIERIGFEFDN